MQEVAVLEFRVMFKEVSLELDDQFDQLLIRKKGLNISTVRNIIWEKLDQKLKVKQQIKQPPYDIQSKDQHINNNEASYD